MKQIRRALLSVSDKTGLLDLAKTLAKQNVELIASGGTAKVLQDAGLKVTAVETLSGKGEAFQGRMKTISFEIASSLLYRREDPQDVEQAKKLGIEPIDLVVVNLYPFHQTLKKQSGFEECIENIDIGGPTLLRAGAKNFKSVTVLCEPSQYSEFTKEFTENLGTTTFEFRQKCAAHVYTMTYFYDLAIAGYLIQNTGDVLRYGENPHQKAFVMKDPFHDGLAHARSLQGKEMSYNNYLDADFALKTLQDIHSWQKEKALPTAVVVKHNTPCGMAVAETPLRALEKAWKGDEKSSFGGIIALNFPVTEEVAGFFTDKFVEVIMAPSFMEGAREKLKKNCRIMEVGLQPKTNWQVRSMDGGMLIQEQDSFDLSNTKVVTKNTFATEKQKLAGFAVLAVKNLKSNAIALCKQEGPEFELVTMGSGQTNRVDCIEKLITPRLADKGVKDVSEFVLASDAFFPFADSVQVAAKLGIKYIIQPGGSVKDNEVIAEADRLGVAMMFTGRRHFLH
ncbi:MAG: bifunctional phosphoribosylaminoimidazolecarboxamide formyltransferase/IMP cyclohydrolase [Bdellovibrio sp.]